MSTPNEYTEAYNKLIAFRQKVFEKLVSGRVKVRLDSNHETLIKYGEVIDQLSVVPYMFGNVKQKALALRLSNRDVSEGEIAQAKSNFALTKAIYPLDTPFNVPARMLPQVDVFVYKPPTDVDLIEKTTESVWANLFLVQTEKEQFVDVGDAENVFAKYFKFRPIGRCKVEVSLSDPDPSFASWNKLTGEATLLVRDITLVADNIPRDYEIYVLVDSNYHSTTDEVGVAPLIILVTPDTAELPEVILVGGGKRLKSTDKGVFAGWVTEGQFVGWTKTHANFTITLEEVLWSNLSQLLIEVNDIVMGTTDPVPAEYTKKAVESVLVTALPNAGYAVKNWELNGLQYPPADTFTVKCYRDHHLICVLFKGDMLAFRPYYDTDQKELSRYGGTGNWDAVDDVISDGDASFVLNRIWDAYKFDFYGMTDVVLPDGYVVDYVKILGRFRRVRRIVNVYSKFHLMTGGITYASQPYYLPNDFEWHVLEKKYSLNPRTGLPWTQVELDACRMGVGMWAVEPILDGYDTGIRCTQVWGEVTYHIP